MNADTQTQLKRIIMVSRAVRALCKMLFGLTLTVFLVMVVLIIIGTESGVVRLGGAEIPVNQLTTGSKSLTIGFLALVFTVVIKGLYHLHRLFANYSRGNIFTIGSVAQIRQLGITFLLGAGLQIFSVPLAVCLNVLSKPNKAAVSLTLPFEAVITAGLLMLISWVMDAGRGLREENELTI